MKLNISSFNKHILTLVSGTGIAQAIPILISPLLTRLYSPAEFGILALLMAIASTLTILSTGRYEMAILLPKLNYKAFHVFIFAMLLSVLCSITLMIFFFMLSTFQPLHEKFPRVMEYWWFIPIVVLLGGLFQILTFWNNRQLSYKVIAKGHIVQSVTLGGAKLILGVFKSSLGLLIGTAVGKAVSVFYLTFKSIRSLLLFKVNKLRMFAIAKRYSDIPRYSLLSALFNNISVHLPILLLSVLYSLTAAGFFSLALRILQLPMSVVGGAVGQVYFREISASKNSGTLTKTTVSLVLRLAAVSFIPTVILMFFGAELFSLCFGGEWRDAGTYASVLSPWIFVVFVVSPVSNLLSVKEKHKELMMFNGSLLSVRAIAILSCFYLGVNEFALLMVYSFVGVVFWLYMFIRVLSLAGSKLMMPFILVLFYFFVMLLFYSTYF